MIQPEEISSYKIRTLSEENKKGESYFWTKNLFYINQINIKYF